MRNDWIVKFGRLTILLTLTSAALAQETLKDAYESYFHIGAALNRTEIQGTDTKSDEIVTTNFDSISPENALKWAIVHPREGTYDFTLADQYVAFGEKHHLMVIGHVLVWHEQTPKWVFADAAGKQLSRDALLQRMRDHIHTVVGRYKGRIHGWDVVNEALNEDGTMRQSEWQKIIGDDYVERAFAYAHEVDQQAELYYNDFELENEAKRKGAIALIAKLTKKGILVSAVGIQSHDSLTWPSAQRLDEAISEFAKLGVKVNITELDVDVLSRPGRDNGNAEVSRIATATPELDPYKSGLPDEMQQKLAARYAELFRVFIQHPRDIARVTFWGVTDATSWLNNWPVRGRTNYPLLFDREGKSKPAYNAVINAARK